MYSTTWLPQNYEKMLSSTMQLSYITPIPGKPKQAPTSFIILDGLFLEVLKYVWPEFLLQPVAVVSEKALQTVPGNGAAHAAQTLVHTTQQETENYPTPTFKARQRNCGCCGPYKRPNP